MTRLQTIIHKIDVKECPYIFDLPPTQEHSPRGLLHFWSEIPINWVGDLFHIDEQINLHNNYLSIPALFACQLFSQTFIAIQSTPLRNAPLRDKASLRASQFPTIGTLKKAGY